jgi:hypothetical protein
MDQLKYPIGRFVAPENISDQRLMEAIDDIGVFPEKLKDAVQLLGENGLNSTYRPNGWTGRQVVHHISDSHMNALIRFKLALTEENPTIKPYMEDLWALLADYTAPVDETMRLIVAIHYRLHLLLTSLSDAQWSRTFYHPENKSSISLKRNALLYQWHGNHHLAHLSLIYSSL